MSTSIAGVGPSPEAKAYRKAVRQRFHVKHLKYRMSHHRERTFGVSNEVFERMKAEQGGVCAICHLQEPGHRNGVRKELAIDHDWATGQVRKLLCSRCNSAIGLMKDSASRLLAAAEYLNAFKDSRITNAGITNV